MNHVPLSCDYVRLVDCPHGKGELPRMSCYTKLIFYSCVFFFPKTTGWVQRIYVYQWTLGQGIGPWWSDMGDQRSPATLLAEVQAITCCESSRVGICAKAGSTRCLSTCQTQETPWMVVEQSKLWSVIVCSELYFFFIVYTLELLFQEKNVLLHIIIIIFFFQLYFQLVYCGPTYLEETVVLYRGALASPKWTCLPSGSNVAVLCFVPKGAN